MILLIDFSSDEDKKKLYKILKSRKARKYSVEIKEDRDNRSNQQNRYYWGVVIKLLCEHTGYSPDEMHDVLKQKFNPKEIVFKKTGETFTVGGHTKELDTLDFMKYLEQIQIWALSELDVLIPEPNEVITL